MIGSASLPAADSVLIALELLAALACLVVVCRSLRMKLSSPTLISSPHRLIGLLGSRESRSSCLLRLATLFGIFAAHSAWRVTDDQSTCGCYGDVTVPPLVSFAATAAFSVWCFAIAGSTNNLALTGAETAESVSRFGASHGFVTKEGSLLLRAASALAFFLIGLSVPTALSFSAGAVEPLIRIANVPPAQRAQWVADLPELNAVLRGDDAEVLIVRGSCGRCAREIRQLVKAERNGQSWSDLVIVSVGAEGKHSTKLMQIRQLRSLRKHIQINESPVANR